MTTETTVLARWSMDITPNTMNTNAKRKAKISLAELFSGFARTLMDDKDVDLTQDHVVELSTVSEYFNQKFVLKLIRIDNDN